MKMRGVFLFHFFRSDFFGEKVNRLSGKVI